MDKIKTTHAVIGDGLTIRRALPSARRRMVGAWCFLDQAGPTRFPDGQGLHVSPHPHIGLQTFTWMMEGELLHRDSLGSEQLVRPGQVNLMTAGRGIVHTEDTVRDGAAFHAAQLWIALPEAQRRIEPMFQHYPDLPSLQAGGFNLTLLVGDLLGLHSPVAVHSPLLGADIQAAASATLELPLNAAFEHAVLVLEGEASVGGEMVSPGTLLYFDVGQKRLQLKCGAAARLLLLGGAPFGENVLLWWNFVARSQQELEVAVSDWNAGRHFGRVPGATQPPLKAPNLNGLHLKTEHQA